MYSSARPERRFRSICFLLAGALALSAAPAAPAADAVTEGDVPVPDLPPIVCTCWPRVLRLPYS